MNKHSQQLLRIQNVVFMILFLAVIGLLAWLGKTYHKDFDLLVISKIRCMNPPRNCCKNWINRSS